MTSQSGISPARYWRETQNWAESIGQTGIVVAATRIEMGLPELESSTPYYLVLIKYDNQKTNKSLELFIGADGHSYKENDHVKCVLRRFSSPGNGLIHYGIKVMPT
jgi:uncharacterized OB-fold protein